MIWNSSFHRASWLSQWPSNFAISQRQSEGCGITFSSGTDPIFTLSFKNAISLPADSQYSNAPVKALELVLFTCKLCQEWGWRKNGKRALVNNLFGDPFISTWTGVWYSYTHTVWTAVRSKDSLIPRSSDQLTQSCVGKRWKEDWFIQLSYWLNVTAFRKWIVFYWMPDYYFFRYSIIRTAN